MLHKKAKTINSVQTAESNTPQISSIKYSFVMEDIYFMTRNTL